MPAKLRAGIYARISEDRQGDELGVTRQRLDCEELVAREGWIAAHIYVDDDMSAYSGKPRPNYLRMLDDLDQGRIDAVVAWHPDRLHRSPRELEDFIALIEKTKAQVQTVRAGKYDLTTPSGRMTARIVGAVSRGESEHRGDRVSRKMLELAQAGQYTGGGRMFGYTKKTMEVVPDEAEIVRNFARRLLAGESLTVLARELNARGVPTTRGREWTTNVLKNLLVNPRLAGFKVYKGDIIGDDAPWKPILDRTTHEQLVRRFEKSPFKGNRKGRTRPLAGLLRCECGHNMIGRTSSISPKTGKARLTYACPKMPGYEGCGSVSVDAVRLEGEVRDRVVARLAGTGLVHALRAAAGDDRRQQELTDQLRKDEASLQQLSEDFYQHRVISRQEFLENHRALTASIDATRKSLIPTSPAGMLSELPATEEGLQEAWDSSTASWKRALVGAVADHVEVVKAKKGRFDPARVRMTWKA